MTIPNLKLFIDGRDAGEIHSALALRPLIAKKTKNTYYAMSAQAVRYGVKVDSTILPNGIESVLSVGSSAKTAVPVSLSSTGDRSKVKGTKNVEVAGVKHLITAGVHDFGDGTFTLMASVRQAGNGTTARPVLSAARS